MKRHIFIINPEAGKKKGLEFSDYINRHFEGATILTTEYPGHASELALEHAGPDTYIYSVGGDGTLNEVVNGIIRSDYATETAVADVPCGSGNDFIKSLTAIKDPIELLKRYKKEETKLIDIGFVNDRSFINISSVGFDAEIVLNAKKYKRLPMLSAELAYVISVFATLIRLRDYKMTIHIDDQEPIETNVLFMVMANGVYYGGGMKAAPDAKVDDGLFDFCIVDKVKRRQVPFLLPKFIKGSHESLKMLKSFRGKKIKIHSQMPLPFNIDGEVIVSNDAKVGIREKAIRLLLP